MITEKFADYISSIEYEDLPIEVVKKAKICFMDFLGVALRGSKTSSGNAVNDIIKKSDDCTVIGHKKAGILDSALANGIAAHSLDLDDGHRIAQLHPGACVIPAALAPCELKNKTGKELITSMVVGYQIAISLGILINPGHRNKGFHNTGTCGTFGAAAAACKVLNLRKEDSISAFGLAGTQASGLLESDHAGSMGKHLHAGKAAQSGVLSALLAKKGFTGAKSIFEGKEGFLAAMSNLNMEDMQIEMDNFQILDVYFKKYPVCRHIHSSIDAALNIVNKNHIDVENIQKITIQTYKIAAEHGKYHPETVEAIRQSLPLSIAIALFNKDLNLNNLEINDSIENITKKISVKCETHLDELYPAKRPSMVKIDTPKQSYTERVDLPRGEPENQFTEFELAHKFNKLNPHLSMDILSMVNNIEDIKVKDLMEMINNEFKG